MKHCIVIPVFNHGKPLAGTIERLQAFRLPIFVVDDGSDESTQALIDEIASSYEFTLLRLPVNEGKGGAVIAGLRAAESAGFTHALQVDADGQHDLSDVPKMLEESLGSPEALISGIPRFDESAPASRLYGRRLTGFWVAIETLSMSMPDTMCGFRIYPLQTTIPLIVGRRIGLRMDFDIEIAVRLKWRGVKIVGVPTTVKYPEDGTSNFRLIRDNWMITKVHVRLVFGMLFRLPLLIARRFGVRPMHWSQIGERGGTLGMRLMFGIYRHFGRWVFSLFLYPVIAYFYATSAPARRVSGEFLHRVALSRQALGLPTKRCPGTFRHLLEFGHAVLDKGAVWAESFPADAVTFDDPSAFERFRAANRGSMFIGSHLGNIEVLRALGESAHGLTVNALVFTRHSAKFTGMLGAVSPRALEHMIQVDSLGPGSVQLLQDRLEAGEHVAIVADRTSVRHRERSIYAEFLGKLAPFPEGPFILAHLLRCPVYLLFCLRVDGRYRIYLEEFAPLLELPRKNRRSALQAVVENYARRLEHYAMFAPAQWFNFFDFWRQADKVEWDQ